MVRGAGRRARRRRQPVSGRSPRRLRVAALASVTAAALVAISGLAAVHGQAGSEPVLRSVAVPTCFDGRDLVRTASPLDVVATDSVGRLIECLDQRSDTVTFRNLTDVVWVEMRVSDADGPRSGSRGDRPTFPSAGSAASLAQEAAAQLSVLTVLPPGSRLVLADEYAGEEWVPSLEATRLYLLVGLALEVQEQARRSAGISVLLPSDARLRFGALECAVTAFSLDSSVADPFGLVDDDRYVGRTLRDDVETDERHRGPGSSASALDLAGLVRSLDEAYALRQCAVAWRAATRGARADGYELPTLSAGAAALTSASSAVIEVSDARRWMALSPSYVW